MKCILVILLAAAVATPAAAANTRKKTLRVYQPDQRLHAQGWRQSRDSWDVYSADGRLIGRDPSPNVRQRLYDDERVRNGD